MKYDSVEEMLLSNPKLLFQKRRRLIALQELQKKSKFEQRVQTAKNPAH